VTNFYMEVLNICGLSVQNMFHIIHLVPRIFMWLLDFLGNLFFCLRRGNSLLLNKEVALDFRAVVSAT
jgi:hypothetical protein